MNRFTSVAFVLLLVISPLQACALSGKAIEGRVLEDGTNKPIPGAIVMARWHGHLASWAHGKTVCYHVLTTTTDDTGTFRFPAWKKDITENWQKNIRFERVAIDAHKAGYGLPARAIDNVYYLQPFGGGREERFKAIRVAGVTCGAAEDSGKNLIPLYRMLYEQARELAVTKEEKAIANDLLYKIDLIELPYEEAEKRNIERSSRLRHE